MRYFLTFGIRVMWLEKSVRYIRAAWCASVLTVISEDCRKRNEKNEQKDSEDV